MAQNATSLFVPGDHLLGTSLGMAPGILAATVLGHRFARALTSPGPGELAPRALVPRLRRRA